MAEYYSKEQLLECKKTAFQYDMYDLEDFLEEVPTADVVEVPCRCYECKHLEIINEAPVYAKCPKQKLTFLLWETDTREHSCSYGERREE